MKRLIVIAGLFTCLGSPAYAQTTGGVFGPNISEGDRSAQFRLGLSPSTDGGYERWESRIHYQQALSDNLRWRIVLQGSNIETGSFESNFLQGEFQWQFKKADTTSSWASALRFDARLVEDDDGANRLGVHWTNQWNPLQDWQLNSVILAGKEVDGDARDGVILELRNGIKYKASDHLQIGIESFSALGRTTTLGSFKTQNHRLGPVMTGKVNKNMSFLVGVLFGASEVARDVDFRIWLGRKF